MSKQICKVRMPLSFTRLKPTSRFKGLVVCLGWQFLLLLISGAHLSAFGQAGTITTIAGGGPNSNVALNADLAQPGSVAVDSIGNIIVAANFMNQVFKVDTSGNFSVLAGTGFAGFAGDNGPANAARLASPWGVAVDRSGNVFITDTGNQRIRRVDAVSGIITTVAGNGIYAFSGDGGPATSASLWDPQGVGLDKAGNLFIADYGNNRIRRVDASTGVITTVAGNGVHGFGGDGGPATSAALNSPWSATFDASGNLFIADIGNYRIRRVDAARAVITTVAGGGTGQLGDGGPATQAFLNTPFGIAVDGFGNLIITDTGDERIRRVDHATGIITTIVGNGNAGFNGDGGPAGSASLNFPMSVALDGSGNFFLADTFNNRLRRVDIGTGKIATLAGGGTGGDGSAAISATLVQPYGIALDKTGNIFIADTVNQRIRRVDAATTNITTVAGTGWQGYSGDGGPGTSAAVSSPRGVAADALGNIYIGDQGNQLVRKVALATGVITSAVGNGTPRLAFAGGVGVDASGNLYIADSGAELILKVESTTGAVTTVAGNGSAGYTGDGGPATSATLDLPQGIAVDASSNLFVADTGNNVIRRIDAVTGIITTVAGNGSGGFGGDGGPATGASMGLPQRVAVDGADNLYIGDLVNNRIRFVDGKTGVMTTIAGNGNAAFSGDGGPATSASLNTPADVAVDIFGNLFIADLSNNRIRKVLPPPNAEVSATSLTFSRQVVGSSSSPQKITLSNIGWQILAISGVAVSGTNAGDFNVTHDCGTALTSGANCAVSVTFTPTAVGTSRAGMVTITDSSSNSPQTIQLSGTGIAPTETVNLSPASLNFGTTLEGTTSATQPVTLTNIGNNSLNIAKITVVGVDYSQTNNCGSSVAAGASCTINVSYAPSSSGTNQTRIDITDDGLSSPQSISLSGAGTEFLLAPTAGASTSQSVVAGQTAQYTLALTPSTTTRDTVTLSCSGAPVTVVCSVLPTLQTFRSTTPVPVSVSVSTMARGALPQSPGRKFFPPVTLVRFFLLLASLAAFLLAIAMVQRLRHGGGSFELGRAVRPSNIALFACLSIVLGAAACGGGGSTTPPPQTGTPVGTYTLTVTAKSASSTNPDQSVVLTLSVQ